MTRVSRREFVALSAAGAAIAGSGAAAARSSAPVTGLSSLTRSVPPIDSPEHDARLAKVQG